MKVVIAIAVCVVVDDGGDPSPQVVPNRNPLDDLMDRMQQEMRDGRGSVKWGESSGTKVA